MLKCLLKILKSIYVITLACNVSLNIIASYIFFTSFDTIILRGFFQEFLYLSIFAEALQEYDCIYTRRQIYQFMRLSFSCCRGVLSFSRSVGSLQSSWSSTWHILFLPHFCQRLLPFYSKLNWSTHAYASVAQAGVFVQPRFPWCPFCCSCYLGRSSWQK